MQELWNRLSAKRYPPAWDGVPLSDGHVVYWTEPLGVQCGRCRGPIGTYRAYQAAGDYGVVEDTSHQYRPANSIPAAARGMDPLVRAPRSNPPHRLDGMLAESSRRTRIIFRCPRCRTGQPRNAREYARNLHNLGQQMFTLQEPVYVLADAAR